MAERKKIEAHLAEIKARADELISTVGAEIPMLADKEIDLDGLARLKSVKVGEVNVVGLRLPALESIEVEIVEYGFLVRPHWVDVLAARLKEVVRMRIEARIGERQIGLLDKAITKVTQRLNLFDKVLIPKTQGNIRKIQIALSDMERSAVVTSKIAKRKREAAA